MAVQAVRGVRTNDLEDEDFIRYFRIVQDAAAASGSVFFLWSPECHDGPVGDVWCEDLSGWLVPSGEADSFETLWLSRDPEIWDDRFDGMFAFARWSKGEAGGVVINFESPW